MTRNTLPDCPVGSRCRIFRHVPDTEGSGASRRTRGRPGKTFLTLNPGDRYDLAARRVTHRAITDSPLTQSFVDSLLAEFAAPRSPPSTVLVAQAGEVLVDAAYGIPPQRKYMPSTTIPNFPLFGLSSGFNAAADAQSLADRIAGRLLSRAGR